MAAKIALLVAFSLLFISSCDISQVSQSDETAIGLEYDPRLSSVEIIAPAKRFYAGADVDRLLVKGNCTGQINEGGRLNVTLTLANKKYQALCSAGGFTKSISLDDLAEKEYVLEAEVIGLTPEDTAKDQSTIIKDIQAPHLQSNGIVFPANKTYTINEAIDVTFVFTEAVNFFGSSRPELSLILGPNNEKGREVIAGFSSVSENRVTFRYIVQEKDQDVDGIKVDSVSVSGVELIDLAGNKSVDYWGSESILPATSANVRIDTSKSYIKSITPALDSTYVIGDAIYLSVLFSKKLQVEVPRNGLGPRLLLLIGDKTNKVARFVKATGNTIMFQYDVISGDQDTDGVDVIGFDINETLIADNVGKAPSTKLPASPSPTKKGFYLLPTVLIDGDQPKVVNVSLNLTEAKLGETIQYDVTFSEKVNISGFPVLNFTMGSSSEIRKAVYDGHSGVDVGGGKFSYGFTYTLLAGDRAEFLRTGENLLSQANGSSIKDDRNDASLKFTQQAFQVNYDAVVPKLQSIDAPPDKYYRKDDELRFNLLFSENIVSDSSQDTYLDLQIGGDAVRASLDPQTLNSRSVSFLYQIEPGNIDTNGITLRNLEKLSPKGVLTDRNGNTVSFNLDGFRPDLSNVRVDTFSPQVVRLRRPLDGTYSLRQGFNELSFRMTFNEEVAYNDSSAITQLGIPLNIGGVLVSAIYQGSSGTYDREHTFSYKLMPNLVDSDGVRAVSLWLDASTTQDMFFDRAGNELVTAAAASEPTYMPGVLVDTTIPKVTALRFLQDKNKSSTLQNSNLVLELEFDESVTSTPVLRIPFRLGPNTVASNRVDYFVYKDNGSSPLRKRFYYAVQEGDNDDDGLLLGLANNIDKALQFGSGGSIVDTHGNSFDGSLRDLTIDILNVVIDTKKPTIERVNTSSALKQYFEGDKIYFNVVFSEDIYYAESGSVDKIRLPLSTDNTSDNSIHYAEYRGLSGNNRTAEFVFTVPSGMVANSLSITASGLDATSGDAFKDFFQNTANLDFSNDVDINLSGISIDASVATITSITAGADHYGQDETIDLYVNFNMPVSVTGSSQIDFHLDDSSTGSFIFAGKVSDTSLHYRHKVKANENTANGVRFISGVGSLGAIKVTSGSITKSSSNSGVALGFPVGALPNVIIDSKGPQVTSFTFPFDKSYTIGEVIDIFVNFDEPFIYDEWDLPNYKNLGIAFNVGGSVRHAEFNDVVDKLIDRPVKFSYTVQKGDQQEVASFTFDPNDQANASSKDLIKDQAGNKINTVYSEGTDTITIDASGPAITQVIPPNAELYTVGEKIAFTVLFNENIVVDGSNDISLPFRMLNAATGVNTLRSMKATGIQANSIEFSYIVANGDQDYDGIDLGENAIQTIKIDKGSGSIKDAKGIESNYEIQSSNGHANLSIDARSPTITAISGPISGNYGKDETLKFTFTFSEEVQYNAGTSVNATGFTLKLGTDTVDLTNIHLASHANNTLAFQYIISQGIKDSDGIELLYDGSLSNTGRIVDNASIPASIDLSRFLVGLNLSAINVDTKRPSIASVGFVNEGQTVLYGEEALLTIEFDEDIVVTGSSFSIPIFVGDNNGSPVRQQMTYKSATNRSITFAYSPGVNITDSDGIQLETDSSNLSAISLSGSRVQDSNGNNARLAFYPPTKTVKIDTNQTIVQSITLPNNGWHFDSLDFEVTFSDDVEITPVDLLSELSLSFYLSPGVIKSATNVKKKDNKTFVLSYSIDPNTIDSDGIKLKSPLVFFSPSGSKLVDSRGSPVSLAINPGFFDLSKVFIANADANITSTSASFITDDPTNKPIYNTDVTFSIIVNYDIPVIVNTTGGTPRIPFRLGNDVRYFTYKKTNDSRKLVFDYQVRGGDQDLDGIALGTFSSGAVIDANGGQVLSPNNSAAPVNFASSAGYDSVIARLPAIDYQEPTVTRLSAIANTYAVGDTIKFSVEFSEKVILNPVNALNLSIEIGSVQKTIAVSRSTTNVFEFDYTVVTGDEDMDGVTVKALQLIPGGTLKDDQGNGANLALTGVGLSTLLPGVFIKTDTKAPKLVDFSASGSYVAGDQIRFTALFDENVYVTGIPAMNLLVGSHFKPASYVANTSGVDSKEVWFTYDVVSGDIDSDGIVVSSIAGTIKDKNGNDANLSYVNDTTAAIIVSSLPIPSIVAINANQGNYSIGNNVSLKVEFDEDVEVTGIPQLELTIGSATRSAAYSSGGGGKILTFTYVVKATDIDLNGIEVKSLSLNSGTIQSQAGSAADLAIANSPITLKSVIVIGSKKPSTPSIRVSDIEGHDVGDVANNGTSDSDKLLITVAFSAPGIATEAIKIGDTVKIYNGTGLMHSEVLSASDITLGYLAWRASNLNRNSTYSFKSTITDSTAKTSEDSNIINVTISNPPAERITTPITVSDTDGNHHHSSGDVMSLFFNQQVDASKLTASSLSVSGSPLSPSAISPSSGFVSEIKITLGSSLSQGDRIIIDQNSVVNQAGTKASSHLVFVLPDITPPEPVPASSATALALDADSNGVYSLGDKLELVLSEPIQANKVSTSSVLLNNSHKFGFGYTVRAQEASVTITLGTAPSIVAGDTISLEKQDAMDKSGNIAGANLDYLVPSLSIASIENISITPKTYSSGDKLTVLIQFSSAVTVDTAGSVITIDLNVGGSIVQARYAATTADTMEFIYIASGAIDLHGVEVIGTSIMKGGKSSIKNAGVAVTETFATKHFPNVKVNAPFDLSKITDIWFDSVDIDADGDSTDQSVGYAVKTFYDKSGNDHHISSGAGGEPEVKLNADNNGNLSVYFEAASRNFLGGTKDPNLGTSGYTYFTAFNASHNSAGGSFNYLFGTRGDFAGGNDNANGVATYLISSDRFHLNSFSLSGTSNGRVNIVPAVSLTNTPVFVSESHSPGLSRVFSQGGQPDETLNVGTHLTAGKRVSMGGLNGASYFANGYVNEAFYFNRTLTLAERAIIENYLGAKWSSPHSTLDYYSGDDNSKSDYDHDVTGILKLSPTTIGSQTLPASSVSTARNGALLIANSASDGFLKDEGDRVFAGGKGGGATTANLSNTAFLGNLRSSKIWYLDIFDAGSAGGKIDLAFTPSLMGFDWTADAASYELLWRAGVSGDFVRVALSSGATNDVVHFRGIDVHTSISDGLMASTDNIIKSGYITLAMADKTPPSLRYAEVTGDKEITLTFDESIANQISGLSLAANTIIGTNIHAKSTNKIVITTGNSIKSAETLSYSGSVVSDIAGNELKALSGIVVDMPRASIIRLTSSSIVVAGAGDDAITASSGSDVFDYNFITDGNDTISGFNKDKDKIDLSDVLQYSNGQDIAKFVAVSDDGTNTTINVDAHGRGNTSAATRDISITLNGVTGSTLDSLINDEVLVVTAP